MANASPRALSALLLLGGLLGPVLACGGAHGARGPHGTDESRRQSQGDTVNGNEFPMTRAGTAALDERLLGTWTLVSHTTFRDGTGTDTGTHPKGLLVYTAEGRMMVAISFEEGVADPAKNIFYAGTFHVEDDTVVHHVEISSDPTRVGTDQVRKVRFAEDRLELRAGDETRGGLIVWQRAKTP